MKVKVSEKSWHYRLATVYGPIEDYNVRYGISFCWYFWSVILGATIAIAVALFGSIVAGAFILSPLIYFFSMFELGVHTPDLFTGFALGIELAFAAFLYLAYHQHINGPIDFGYIPRKLNMKVNPEPGFLTLAYRKFKNKTCFTVSTVD